MRNKKEILLKEIGNWFGVFKKDKNEYTIDNGEKIFRYKTAEAGLIDWLDTLKQADADTHDNLWQDAILFIEKECL